MAGGWTDFLDRTELGSTDSVELVKWLRSNRNAESVALVDGSLFHFTKMAIHPILRGQRFGARLMGQALAMLQRSECDAAVLMANPITSIFEQGPADRTLPAMHRLVAYYESMGFRRWRPRRKLTAGAPVLLYVRISEDPLNYEPIGSYWTVRLP